ncbi:hypothetical protein V6Z11_A06G014400 [Gossypium hirsutum]
MVFASCSSTSGSLVSITPMKSSSLFASFSAIFPCVLVATPQQVGPILWIPSSCASLLHRCLTISKTEMHLPSRTSHLVQRIRPPTSSIPRFQHLRMNLVFVSLQPSLVSR